MRPVILTAILFYTCLALRLTLFAQPPIAMQTPWGPASPDLLLAAVLIIGLTARRQTTLPIFLAAGFLTDIATAWPLQADRILILLGPHTLGYLAAYHVLGKLRQLLIRHHPLSAALAVVVCGAALHLTAIGIISIRTLYETQAGFTRSHELYRQALSLLYTAPIAAILAALLPLQRWARNARSSVNWTDA